MSYDFFEAYCGHGLIVKHCRNVVWLGDLNYRIDMDYHTVVNLAETDDFDTLLAHDQVRNLRQLAVSYSAELILYG